MEKGAFRAIGILSHSADNVKMIFTKNCYFPRYVL